MPPFPPLTLHCPRLHLRFLKHDDVRPLFDIFADQEAMRYWSSSAWTDVAQAEDSLAGRLADYAAGTALRLGIDVDGTLAGTVTLRAFDARNRRCEIGYMLARPYWGRGLMQEALPAALAHAFGTLDMHRIEADVDPRNTASGRLLERLGFRLEGRLRERWLVNGEVCDSDMYGLLRSDWHART